MTEHELSPTPETDAIPVDFDLDDWINGGTIAERSVAIYGRPDLIADIEEWQRRHNILEQRAKAAKELGDDREMGAFDEIEASQREGAALFKEWEKSKADWRVRALDVETEIEELRALIPTFDDLPTFDEPEPPAPRDHTGSPSAAFTTRHAAWTKRRDAFLKAQKPEQDALNAKRRKAEDEHRLQCIARAVVSIKFADGNIHEGVTVEQLRKMQVQIGRLQVMSLFNAASLATMAEPTIPVPFSRPNSKGARG